jgi:hypothetical protein
MESIGPLMATAFRELALLAALRRRLPAIVFLRLWRIILTRNGASTESGACVIVRLERPIAPSLGFEAQCCCGRTALPIVK